MIHRGHVIVHSGTSRRQLAFESVRLELQAGGKWDEGRWVFLGEGEPVILPCATVENISVDDAALFPVTVVEPGGEHGPYSIQGVVVGDPLGAHCFLYAEREDNGFWVGHTVATGYGKVIVQPYECDPN